MRNKILALASLLIIASMVLGACAQQPTPAPQGEAQVTTIVETVEVMVEGTPMVVTATPEPTEAPREFTSADPSTLVQVSFGEAETFDPGLDYESAGGNIIVNTYDGLVFYNREKAGEFIPMLAEEVPTAENGGITEDGTVYTFKIREGVKFHDGADLTPSDVAFTFVRNVLQGGTASPQWLFTEPFFGVGVDDISVLVEAGETAGVEAIASGPVSPDVIGSLEGKYYDDAPSVQAVDPAVLAAVCERAKTAVVDNGDGTVSFHLAQSWAPFIPTLAGFWGGIMDQDWVAANGGWDGDCATWQNFYAVTSENSPFTTIVNGTGPFKLDHWTQGEEIVLVRNDDYWRTEPMWEGGPSGPAALERVVIRKVDEWGTRFAMLQAGDADFATVNRENVGQVDPMVGELCTYNEETNGFDCEVQSEEPLRLFMGAPQTTRTDVFLNFNISNPDGSNTFIGSGQLDGNGIPVDFFSDIHIRKAFNYCFDWETYIQDALVGEGIQSVGIPMVGMPGYDPDGPVYSFDPDLCAQEFQAAELTGPNGETVWDTGFRMQIAYNTGNTTRQTVAQILGETLAGVNELFQVEVIGLPWPTFLRAQRDQTLPVFISGWIEDIHDPHNWYVPYLVGTYGRRQSLPQEIVDQFQSQVNAGVAETDPEARHAIYQQLNQDVYDLAPQIILAVATQRHYEQRWVEGWYYNPIYPDQYYYPLSKK